MAGRLRNPHRVRPPARWSLVLVALIVVLGFGTTASAQAMSNVVTGFKNSWAVAGSYGQTFDQDSWLWGISTDYTRVIAGGWMVNASIAYDQETTTKQDQPDEIDNTFTLQLAAGYPLSKRFVVGGGIAKGIIDNKEGQPQWNWKKFSDDWTVGALAVYTYWIKGRHSLDVTGTLEYRVNEKKPAWSFDLGYGYSF